MGRTRPGLSPPDGTAAVSGPTGRTHPHPPGGPATADDRPTTGEPPVRALLREQHRTRSGAIRGAAPEAVPATGNRGPAGAGSRPARVAIMTGPVGAGIRWHELEHVPAGSECTPRLLRDLTAPDRAERAWQLLRHGIGWWWSAERLPRSEALLGCLLELLPDLAPRHRAAVLGEVAHEARAARSNGYWTDPRVRAALTAAGPAVLPLLADGDPAVRSNAARVLEHLRTDVPGALDELRRRAQAEHDPAVLGRQLLAAGEVLAAAGTPPTPATPAPAPTAPAPAAPDPGSWLRPWLEHPDPHVRLAATTALLTATRPPGPPAPAATGRLRGDERERRAAVLAAGAELDTLRHPPAEHWELVLEALSDPDVLVAYEAERIVARGGGALTPYVARLLPFAAVPDDNGAAHVVRGLAHTGDPRVLPWYLKHPCDGPLPAAWAEALIPGRSTVGGPVEAVLARWGPAAAPAVPRIVALLDTPSARTAAEVLGRIGPPAAPAADTLAALARGELRPPRHDSGEGREPARWHGAQTAAWAHWRVTGDPRLALDVIGAAARAGQGRPVLPHLADLGPLAAEYADAVRPLLASTGAWTRVGAAHAWWRLTGDADTAVAVLLPELAPLAGHRAGPLVRRAVSVLGAIGRPAAPAVPLLTGVVTSERRYDGGIPADEELLREVTAALTAIGPSAG